MLWQVYYKWRIESENMFPQLFVSYFGSVLFF